MPDGKPCTQCEQRVSLNDSPLCSLCEAPPMFALSGTPHQEDDWFETPMPLAAVCVAQVIEVIEAKNFHSHAVTWDSAHQKAIVVDRDMNPVRQVLCPAVGRGMFPLAVRSYYDDIDAPAPYIAGCDVADRDAKGLDAFTCTDGVTWVPGVGPWDLGIDNIPFDVEVAVPMVLRFTEVCAWFAAILPWAGFGGVDVWQPIMDSEQCRPLFAWPIAPRPWGNSVRETALYLWRRGEQPKHTRVTGLPRWKP